MLSWPKIARQQKRLLQLEPVVGTSTATATATAGMARAVATAVAALTLCPEGASASAGATPPANAFAAPSSVSEPLVRVSPSNDAFPLTASAIAGRYVNLDREPRVSLQEDMKDRRRRGAHSHDAGVHTASAGTAEVSRVIAQFLLSLCACRSKSCCGVAVHSLRDCALLRGFRFGPRTRSLFKTSHSAYRYCCTSIMFLKLNHRV